MEANPAEAAVFTYDFTVDITSGVLVGNQYSGSFSYDDSSPRTSFGGYRPLNFSFDFFGKTYTEVNLIVDAGGYGGFFPGQGLETADLSSDNRIFFLRENGLENGRFFAALEAFPAFGESGKVTYQLRPPSPPTSVPEPGTVGSLLFLGLSSLFLKRKS